MRPAGCYIGQVIGNKQIVSEAESSKDGHRRYLWKCLKCNTVQGPRELSKIRRYENGMCCRKTRLPENLGFAEISSKRMVRMRSEAKRRGLAFEVSAEYLWEIWLDQQGKCAYTGLQLTQDKGASVDRKDSSLGYVPGNVQWVHFDINYMKKCHSEEYFLFLCRLVSEHAQKH